MLRAIVLAWTRLSHRRLATALTAMSVALGTGLAAALLVLRADGVSLLARQPHGFDLIVGAKGSSVDLALNTLYHLERSPGTIPWTLYEDMTTNGAWTPMVASAVPLAAGDSVGGCDIIATTPQFFAGAIGDARDQVACWDPGSPPGLAAGRMFRPASIDAVIGSDVPARAGLGIGSTFHPVHGTGDAIDPSDVHDRAYAVVGVLAPTGTIVDRSVYITLEGFWSIDEHEEGLHAQAAIRGETTAAEPVQHSTVAPDGTVHVGMPVSERRLSAILVRSRGPYWAQMIAYRLSAGEAASAVNPTAVLAGLMRSLLAPVGRLCAALVALILAVAGAGILITCYQAVQAQAQELAVLRALGATRAWILAMVVAEAGLTGFIGAVAGILPGHLMVWGVSRWLNERVGEGIPWWHLGAGDAAVVAGATALAALVGLAPGWRACRVQVAEQLC